MTGTEDKPAKLRARRLAAWLAFGAALMVAGGLVSNLATLLLDDPSPRVVMLLKAFNLDNEMNVPTWFASFLLAVNGGLLLLMGANARARALPDARAWGLLGLVFLVLSLDETATIHEHLSIFLTGAAGLTAHPQAWVLLGGPFAALVALAYARALTRLPRRSAVAFMLSGGLYFTGVIGLEAAGWVFQALRPGWSPGYLMLTWVEETLEFAGQSLFAWAILDLLAVRRLSVRLD